MTVPKQAVVDARPRLVTARAQQLADEAMELVGTDPSAAIARAELALASARGRQDAAARTLAWRALGLGARAQGDLATADAALQRAVRSATQAGDLQSAAEARMTRSFVLLDLGKTSQALRQSATAADVLDGLPKARLEAQRGLILLRAGRLPEARAIYDDVVPALRAAEDRVWESRVLSNRGILHAFLGDLGAADADLSAAYELRTELGLHMDAAQTLWNLGCLSRERGDVVRALERFDAAEPVLVSLGAPGGQHHVDRASLLLSVGVVDEARELAESARAAFEQAGQAADLMECEILLSRIALASRDGEAAAEFARSARAIARTQKRPGWVMAAELLEVMALEQSVDPDPGLARRAERLAEALAEHSSEASVEARLAAARIAARQGRQQDAEVVLSRAGRASGRETAVMQLRRWQTVAVLRHARGDDAGASRAVRAGMAVLAKHRATLGASDLQAHVPAIGEGLARLGLVLAIDSGRPERVLRELERWRGQDMRSRPLRPPRDPELSEAMDRLRRATSDLRELTGRERPDGSATAAVAQREREVVRLSRRTRAGTWRPVAGPPEPAELRTGLGTSVLVEFLVVSDRLYALTLSGHLVRGVDRPRLTELGAVAPIRDLLAHLQFALARLAMGRGSANALRAAQVGALQGLDELDERLFGPLRMRLDGEGVVIAPTEALHAVPWNLLPSIRSKPVHLVRSGTAWLGAVEHRRRAEMSREDPSDVFVTGPGVTLAPRMAPHGATDVVQLHGPDATVAATLAALDEAGIAHLAAHGSFRSDNPMLSSLQLVDGPLTVYDLEGLERVPRLVVLAACDSATARVLPGNQLLGVTHALLTLGSAGVVATTLVTPDADTAVLMESFHDLLAAGQAPGKALHTARRSLDLDSPSGLATCAGFELYGC
jgi:tetratricopeptide (TPR) repeat protein